MKKLVMFFLFLGLFSVVHAEPVSVILTENNNLELAEGNRSTGPQGPRSDSDENQGPRGRPPPECGEELPSPDQRGLCGPRGN